MATTGIAEAYVMRSLHKEKMKKREKELQAKSDDKVFDEKKIPAAGCFFWVSRKTHSAKLDIMAKEKAFWLDKVGRLGKALHLGGETDDSFLKQDNDEEAVFKRFRDINELIKDMLEIKGRYGAVEIELKEMHERYSQLSLQFTETRRE